MGRALMTVRFFVKTVTENHRTAGLETALKQGLDARQGADQPELAVDGAATPHRLCF